MAKTYAGYVKRDEKSFIDWGQIGKDFSDKLFEERQAIVDNKREIQKDDNQFMDNLANNPMTGVNTVDDFTTDMVGKIQNQLLMLNQSRERGELGDQAYVQIRQRIQSGYTNVSNLAKTAGEKMMAVKEKIAKGIPVSKAEIALQETIEEMSNFAKTKYYIDPYDGRSYLSKIELDENGIPTTRIDKEKLYSIQSLNEISQRNVNVVDASKIADNVFSQFSKTSVYKEYENKFGAKSAYEYFFKKDSKGNFSNPDGIKALELSIEQALAQNDVVVSVLADNEGSYGVNGSLLKSDDEKTINIMSEGGSIQFDVTDEQRSAAKEYMMGLVKGRFTKREIYKEAPIPKPTKISDAQIKLMASKEKKRQDGMQLYRTYNEMLSDFDKGVNQYRNLQTGNNRADVKVYRKPKRSAGESGPKEGSFVNLTDEILRELVGEAKSLYTNKVDQVAYLNTMLTGAVYDNDNLSTEFMHENIIIPIGRKATLPTTKGGSNTKGDPNTGL